MDMNKLKQTGIWLIGWVFLFLGFLGLFLPGLQGILFIMIGLAILSTRSKTIQRFLKHLEKRYPQFHEHVAVWVRKVKKWFEKGGE